MRLRPPASPVTVRVDGTVITAAAGETVAAALFAHGITPHGIGASGQDRAAFCGVGLCHGCAVTIDGRMGQLACRTRVAEGMQINSTPVFRPDPCDLADLGSLPDSPLPVSSYDVAVIGAGPAGVAAATIAAGAGLKVVLLEERHDVPGSARLAQLASQGVTIRLDSLVWGAFGGQGERELVVLSRGVANRVKASWIVIATGAYRPAPLLPGASLPGVLSVDFCQALVIGQAVAPGRSVVFAGTGPALLIAAGTLARQGGHVAAVILHAPGPPRLRGESLRAMQVLRQAGVPIHWGHALRRIEGTARVERVIAARLGGDGELEAGSELAFDADAVSLGTEAVPTSHLARLLGCAHEVAAGLAVPMVRGGDDGATSQPDVFVVGAAYRPCGAAGARAQGCLAGSTVARLAGRFAPDGAAMLRRLRRARVVDAASWRGFSGPEPLAATDDTMVCPCEGLTYGRLCDIASANAVTDIATLKRLTRAAMGRCQGRFCAAHLPGILGIAPTGERDLLAPQVPLRPVPLVAIAVEKPEWGGHRRSMLPEDRAPEGPIESLRTASTIIVGAGVAGLSTAYFLAREGHDVLVIDAGRPNAMASGANAGSLHVQLLSFDFGAKAEAGGSPAARTVRLQLASVALWQALQQETGADFELRITGGVMVAETERELRFLADKTALERRMGIESEVVTAQDLARLEPNLAPGLLGAAYCADEGKINPMLATHAILKGALAAGARVFEQTGLRSIERTPTGFLLHTTRGPLAAGRLVNAAGAFASRIGAMLGYDVPVFGAPLQMVVTEPLGKLVNGLVAHADRHLSLKQAPIGPLVIGGGWSATLDGVHQRPRPLRDSLEGNLWVAQRVVPALRRAHVVRSWAAMNVNIDGAPILGEHPAEPGFYNTVSSNGYTLGPILGRITADLILHGRTDIDIGGFGIDRFAG